MGNVQETPSVQETLRSQVRELKRSEKHLRIDGMRLERSRKDIERKLKDYAKSGNIPLVQESALEYARTNDQIIKLNRMANKLKALGNQLENTKNINQVTESFASVVLTLKRINEQSNVSELRNLQASYEQEEQLLDIANELTEELIDNDEIEEETDEIVARVLHEVGIETAQTLAFAPSHAVSKYSVNGSEKISFPLASHTQDVDDSVIRELHKSPYELENNLQRGSNNLITKSLSLEDRLRNLSKK